MLNFRSIKSTSPIFAVSLAIVFLAVTSCGPKQNDYYYINGATQGTTYTIIADHIKINILQQNIDAILLDFDRCLSSYRDSSVVSIFSNAEVGSHQYTDINNYFQRCFALSETVYDISKGAFDPSIYPLVSAWGFMKDPALQMTNQQVDSVHKLIGFNKGEDYIFQSNDPTRFTLQKLRPSLRMDFNAIAQGLAVDVLCEYLDEQQIQNYYVEIGGELRVKGLNKEGKPWRIGIEVADENNSVQNTQRDVLTVIGMEQGAVATSGNYRKFYEIHGKKRSHTIDPITGFPVEHNLLSATVLAKNTALADAMATVFMVWGSDKTIAYIKNNPQVNLEILLQFVDPDNEVRQYMSPGFEKLLIE